MLRITLAIIALAFSTTASAQDKPATAPAAKPPLYAITKIAGTDNVYIFRYGNHQARFVVTPDGVIATDPIGYGRPRAATTYIDEIRKITKQPIKDAGATIVAHRRALERLEMIKGPLTPLPDETFSRGKTIRLGGTTLELSYHGLNHSDSTIVMRLPRGKIISSSTCCRWVRCPAAA